MIHILHDIHACHVLGHFEPVLAVRSKVYRRVGHVDSQSWVLCPYSKKLEKYHFEDCGEEGPLHETDQVGCYSVASITHVTR